MDFLNRGVKQVVDLFQTMTPAARLMTGMLLAVLLVSLVFIFRQNVDGGGEYLFGAQTLTDPEIAVMEGAFGEAGLAGWQRDGFRIRVPATEKHKYMAALAAAQAMPETAGSAYQKMLNEGSLLDPRPVMKIRERHAREQSVAHMIRELSGVQNASVRIQEAEQGGFPRRVYYTAVAIVKGTGSKHLDRDQISTIRNIVAASSGAKREDVVVADSNANLSYRGSGANGLPLAEEDPYAARVRLYQDETKRSIERMLTMYPGALVEVRAELGRDFINREDSLTYDQQPVTVVQSNSTKTDSSTSAPHAGRPGSASNGLGNTPQQVNALASNEDKSEETREETQALPGATQTTIQKYGMVPERVTASIRIPRSLFRKFWLIENPPAEGEDPVEPTQQQLDDIELRETQDIKDIVTGLLPPPPPGDDPYPLVTVTPYTSTPIDDPPTPGLAATAGGWFASNWQTVGLFGVAIFSVFFLRSMVRSSDAGASADSAMHEPVLAHDGLDDDDLEETDLANSLRAKFQTSERSLRDELTELVREDPDAAANVLSNWIGEAA